MSALRAEPLAREIVLCGRTVGFTLKRSTRRTLGLRIDRRGLTVSLPWHVAEREAEAFMHQRAGWILEKLAELASREAASGPLQLRDGMSLTVLGEPCTVSWLAGANRARWVEGFETRRLDLHLRSEAEAARVLLRGLQDYALAYFGGRLQEYLFLLERLVPGIPAPALRLSNARTRWGSCSSLSGIRLNWRLIHLPRAQIDYVVAHEVAHLVEMNHSERFWNVVAALMPDYPTARAGLRQAGRYIPAL